MPSRPILSLTEIDAFDPQGPPSRKWCPLCGHDKPRDAAHRCLSLDRSSGLWKCFRCNASGQAREFWVEKPAFPSRQAKRESLRAAFDLKMTAATPLSAPQAPQVVGNELPPQNAWKTRWMATQPLQDTDGSRYLLGRGVSLGVSNLAEVRWSANWSGHPAVVFPIRARVGEIVAAQARAIRGAAKLTAGPKKEGAFFAPIAMNCGRVCGPLDQVVPVVILVEAPIDALSLAACGFPALALCGTSGPAWLHIACGLRRVALAFDADDAGEAASDKIGALLHSFGARCERLRPEAGKDWNEELQTRGEVDLGCFLASRLLI